MSIRILLADDHNLVRQGLRAMLEKQADIEIVAEAADGQSALNLAEETMPDIIIMDISMPGLNGIEATQKIINENPKIKVLALSMYEDKRFVTAMLCAGASGYILKDRAFDELVHAIHTVSMGHTYLDPVVADTLVIEYVYQAKETDQSAFSVLTEREREVLQLLSEGKTIREIAFQLSLSAKTIETHREKIMAKLNTHCLADLVKYAIQEGLTSLNFSHAV